MANRKKKEKEKTNFIIEREFVGTKTFNEMFEIALEIGIKEKLKKASQDKKAS